MDSKENGPPPVDQDDQRSEAKPASKKKKSSTQLGGFALASGKSPGKKEKAEKIPTADDIWSKLTLTKRREGQTVETIPLSTGAAENAREQSTLTQPETEQALPLEELSPEEAQLVARHIAAERQTAAAEAVDDSDATEGYMVTAAEAVENFRSKIIQEGHNLEEAFIETIHELEAGLARELVMAVETGSNEPESGNVTSVESPDIKESLAETIPRPPVDCHTEPFTPPEARPQPAAALPAQAPLARSRSRSSLAPAATELSPRGLGEYRLNTFARKDGQPSTERVPLHDELTLRNLPGGIVGYLIGRRRGRIKTEKKLAATRKKLEARIDDLQESIITNENHIRKVVRMSKKESYETPARPEEENSRVLAMEANQLHGKQHPIERIGRVLIKGEDERAESKNGDEPVKTKAAIEKVAVDKRVETMNRTELLRMSEKVQVDGTTLRQVYETHLVDEQGLRRLVSEYVRGGDVHETLREELVEHEIDFERDPILRGRRKQHRTDAMNDETLTSLLEKANALGQDETEDELAVLKARQQHHETIREKQQNHRRVMDVSMIAAITILFILVVILLSQGR